MPQESMQLLRQRCRHPLPGVAVHRKFAPEMAYGRHHGPVPVNAHEAAVILALVLRDGVWSLPLTLRSETVGDHRGQVSLPGGRLETNENPWFGAIREFREELGVEGTDIELLAPLTPLYVYGSNHRVQPFLAVCTGEATFKPNPDEVARLIWTSLEMLQNIDNYHIATMQRGTSYYDARGFRVGDQFVWGATAMILAEFVALFSATD